MKEKLTILLLDDEPNNVYSLKGYLRREFNVLSFTQVSDALENLELHDIHIIIADQKMPQMLGLDFLNICRTVKPNAFRILISAHVESDKVKKALHDNTIYFFAPKPIDWLAFDTAIESILKLISTP